MPEWDDDEDDSSSDLVKDLRKQLKEARNKSKEYETELSTLRPQVRKSSINSILSTLKVNPKIAALVPNDVEVTEDAVKTWLTEYGDIFGIQKTEDKTPVDDPPNETVAAPGVDPAIQQAWAQIQSGESATGSVPQDIEAQQIAQLGGIASAAGGSFDKFMELMNNRGSTP
jgi:hypothetical protein